MAGQVCSKCGQVIQSGEKIIYEEGKPRHTSCPVKLQEIEVEAELERDPKFQKWIKTLIGWETYKALPLEVRRGWREQYRREHGIPTSVEVLQRLLRLRS